MLLTAETVLQPLVGHFVSSVKYLFKFLTDPPKNLLFYDKQDLYLDIIPIIPLSYTYIKIFPLILCHAFSTTFFFFLETGSYYVPVTVLELSMWTRLVLNLQKLSASASWC